MKILNVPIEPIEERYSIQWDEWFKKGFAEAELNVINVYGKPTKRTIEHGSFLDVIETNKYKTDQLSRILKFLEHYDDSYSLVLFFHDLWFPGLANIAYVRDGMGFKNLKICGCLHAGSYDPYDFLNKQGMTPWAEHLENSMFTIADIIFVATKSHVDLVMSTRKPDAHIQVTGFPMYMDTPKDMKKKNIVVFPHRLDSEKNPQHFDGLKNVLQHRYPDWQFIRTKDVCETKDEYYKLLKKSKIAVSFADQETWGIAMQEALLLGCVPICPNRLSYTELYDEQYLYNSLSECNTLVERYMKRIYEPRLLANQNRIRNQGKRAIKHMITLMKHYGS